MYAARTEGNFNLQVHAREVVMWFMMWEGGKGNRCLRW
jgi:hypothetical protein